MRPRYSAAIGDDFYRCMQKEVFFFCKKEENRHFNNKRRLIMQKKKASHQNKSFKLLKLTKIKSKIYHRDN